MDNSIGATLQHGGYDGSVIYSVEDKMLHGRVSDIRDMISYGGTTVRQLEKNFRDAVDEYLAMCKETGKVPNKPFKGSFNVRIPQELHLRAVRFAEQNDRKLNGVKTEALTVPGKIGVSP